MKHEKEGSGGAEANPGAPTQVSRAVQWGAALLGGALLGPLGYGAALALGATFQSSLALGALLAGVALAGSLLSYRGTCPACAQPVRFSNVAVEDAEGRTLRSVVDGYVACPACRRYSRHREGKLVELEPEHLADRPVFEVLGSDLGAYSPEAPSPEICCACGNPAEGAEEYPLRVGAEELGFGSVRVQKAQVELGHCARHENAAAGDGSVIWLRSYAVWRKIVKS